MSKLIHYSGPAGSILLPQGYTRLAYIESTGTLWVDTGWKTTNKTEIYTEMYVDGNSCGTTAFPTLFGARNEFTYFGSGNSLSINIRIWNGKSDYNYNFPFNCWNSIHKTPTQCWVNAQERTNYTLSSFTHIQPTYIFANNNSGSVLYLAAIRCKFFRIWDDGNIKRDFVPVQTTVAVTSADGTSCPSGSIGLLDLVENKFYLNKGTGTFIVGPECPQGFPTSEYCLVEWLGNKKATGYVAIPYTHKADTWVDTEMSFDSFYTWNTMFGACTTDNSSDSFTFGCYIGGRINCDFGAAYLAAFGMTAGTFYRFLVSSKTIIKDATTYSPNKTTTACDKTWALFTRHNNTSYINEAGHGKFKYMKIYEGTFNNVSGSTLKAHLIPCYRRSDMKPGFYDLVDRSFHEFVGTGASIGPSITFGWGEVVNNVGATLNAIPHNISTGDGRNGEKNGAFHFDGTSYMEVDAGSILPANCTKYTIMMWTKVDTSGLCALFSLRNLVNNGGRCVLYYNTNMCYDDGVRSCFSHGVTRNNWNHYAFVRNGSNKYVYVNGQLVNTSSASTAGVFSPVLTIGACLIIDSGVVLLFIGDMKDIKIFDTNLDASGIQQEM